MQNVINQTDSIKGKIGGVCDLQKVLKDLEGLSAQGECLKLEAVFWYALSQKSKSTGIAILATPMQELKDQVLLRKESDLQPALLAAARKLVP